MKKGFSFLFVFCLFLIFNFNVSASSFDSNSNFLNVLELATVNGQGYNYMTVTTANNVMNFDISRYTVVYYVDIVYSANGSGGAAVSNLAVKKGNNSANLTIEPIGDLLYRAYGTISRNGSDRLSLIWTTTGTVWVEILQFSAATSTVDRFDVEASVNYRAGSHSGSAAAPGSLSFWYQSSYPQEMQSFVSYLTLDDWTKFDYLDFDFTLTSELESLSVEYQGIKIPYSVSYFAPGGTGWIPIDDVSTYSNSILKIMLRIDVTGLRRNAGDSIYIYINGQYPINIGGSLSVDSIIGYIGINRTDTVYTWLQRIYGAIVNGVDDIVDAINGDSSASDGFQSTIESQGKDLEDLSGDLNSVEKPSVDDIAVDLGSIVSSEELVSNTEVLSTIMNNSIFLPMIIISLTLSFCAYALYGKR